MSKKSSVWHPFTQHGLKTPEVFVESAKGAYLHAKDGRKILDAISSWWVITHGHCHPKIVEAVQAQAAKLDQVIFAGFTHAPAENLAEKLLSLAPHHKHVFFSDSGSTAVEVALKMAIGYWAQLDKPRNKILALDGGYHGDTFGAMSASGRSVFNKTYEPYLFDVTHIPFPHAGQEKTTLKALEDDLKKGDIAAFILEPLVQGAGGMRIYTPQTLKSMADLCQKYNVLLIADEVMTGFGRTGEIFACQKADVRADIVCLSKGLTGGFLPMGATLCTSAIYDAFYHSDRSKMFFHSSSFTGNPLSCAAALANLSLWTEENPSQKIKAIMDENMKATHWFGARPDVENVRTLGTIFALDIKTEGTGYLSAIAPDLYNFYLDNNVLLRPLGNTVYILPPYCVTKEDVERIYDTLWRSLDYIRDEAKQRAA